MTLSLPDSSQHKSVFLPRRSLLVMTGAARYLWRHAIPFRRYDCVDGRLVKREGTTSTTPSLLAARRE
jgi:alkylated DNA repair dioxygenase AlkB